MAAGESARLKATQLREKASALQDQAMRYESGAVGEERVAAVLDGLDRATTRTLHDRLKEPGRSRANLDHLVVTPAGVFLVDAKNWSGETRVAADSLRADGRRRDDEVDKVRSAAAQVAADIDRPVSPVLCLASDNAAGFGSPQRLRGVWIVPIGELAAWLQAQPPARRSFDVGTVAVDLSCRYPEATGDAITLAKGPWASPPPSTGGDRPSRRHARTRAPARSRPTTRRRLPRVLVIAVLAVIALSLGPRLIAGITGGITRAAANIGPVSSSPTTAAAIDTATQRGLDDWRIKAGLYRAHSQPTTLPYMPDASLGAESSACRAQRAELAPFRRALLAAPDATLRTDARRYDRAVLDRLRACAANHPVALHHATSRMELAASDVNARYNRLLGVDPTSYAATRVL